MCACSALAKLVVGLGSAVSVKGPCPPDVVDHSEVEIAHHYRLVDIGGNLAYELAAGVDEIRLPVELVGAQRLHTDAVDRSDEVLVRDRRCRLLEAPQVLRKSPAR